MTGPDPKSEFNHIKPIKGLVRKIVKIQLPLPEIKQAPLHYINKSVKAKLVTNAIFDNICVYSKPDIVHEFWEAIDILVTYKKIDRRSKKIMKLYVTKGLRLTAISKILNRNKSYVVSIIRNILTNLAEYFAEDFGYIYIKNKPKPVLRVNIGDIPDTCVDFIPGDRYR